MRLPHMKYNDSITKQTQIKFGGYNHSMYASEGDIYDMRNISSKNYPLISPREKRAEVTNIKTIQWKGTDWTWSGTTLTIPTTIQVGLSQGDMVSIEGNDTVKGEYIVEGVEYEWNEDNVSVPTEAKITFYEGDFEIGSGEGELSVIKSKKGIGTNVITDEKEEYLTENAEGEEVTYAYDDNKLIKTTVTRTLEGVYYLRRTKTEKLTFTYGDEVLHTYNVIKTHLGASNGRIDVESFSVPEGEISKYTKIRITGLDQLNYNGYHTVGTVYGTTSGGYTKMTGIYLLDNKYTDTDYSREYDVIIYNYGQPVISAMEESDEDVYHTKNADNEEVVISDYVCSGGILKSAVRTTISPADAPSYLIKTVVKTEEVEFENVTPHEITSMASGDKLYFSTSDGSFYYDNVLCGDGLTDSEKQFAETGEYIYILPDNCYFNKAEKKLEKIKTVTARISGSGAYVSDDCVKFFRKTNIMNVFSVGDAVSVTLYFTNSTEKPVFNGIIKEMDYNSREDYCEIYFTESIIKDIDYNDVFKAVISDRMPELKYICAGGNRVWGCDDTTIFCTAFGKPLEWFEYSASNEGNDADISFAITPFDGFGEFTGCCFYDNVPMFFKENAVYKVYGSRASGFSLSTDEKPGVKKGAAKTLTIVNDMLFYLSPAGVMRYYGGSQKCLSDEFLERFTGGVAGADNERYYISMTNGEGYRLFVYDIKKGLWCIEDDMQAVDFINYNNRLYILNGKNKLFGLNYDKGMLSPFDDTELICEENFDSEIEFGDYYMSSPNKKGLSKLFFRLGVDENSSLTLLINYDSESRDGKRVWKEVKTAGTNAKRSYILPVIPKRCDHFRIKLKGHGGFVLYSMSYEYYVGSEL